MNRILASLSNLATKEFCPEVAVPRTDVVPSICLTGLLGIFIGYFWFSCMRTILNTTNYDEQLREVKEEPEETTSEEPGETSTEEEEV